MKTWARLFLGFTFLTGFISCCPYLYEQAGDGRGWGGMMGYGMGGMFMGILFLIIVIIAVYLVIRVLSKNLSESGTAETPLDILKKRYARGELSKEDFDRMKEELKD